MKMLVNLGNTDRRPAYVGEVRTDECLRPNLLYYLWLYGTAADGTESALGCRACGEDGKWSGKHRMT